MYQEHKLPENGCSLCRFHLWEYDEGMFYQCGHDPLPEFDDEFDYRAPQVTEYGYCELFKSGEGQEMRA